MKNKYSTIFFTLLFLGFAIFFLPFTWMDYKVQQKADVFAKDESGNINLKKKQEYLNSLWDKEAFKMLGKSFTYEQIKKRSLNFGLDLQGGMSLIVDVDIDQLIVNLSKKKYREEMSDVLKKIPEEIKNNIQKYVDEIEKAFEEEKLSFSFVDCFENKNHGITIDKSKNSDVKKYLIEKINSSMVRTFDVVRARIDKNGTTQAIIQKLKGSRKIQIEIPGVNNEQQVKDILSNVGELKFWLAVDRETSSAIVDSLTKIVEKENILNSKNEKLKIDKDMIFKKDDVEIIENFLHRQDIEDLLPENIYICKKELEKKKDKDKKEKDKKDDEDEEEDEVKFYFLQTDENGEAILNGDVISDARPTIDDHGKQAISIKMDSLGTKLWSKITGDNIGRTIVTTMDGKEIMAANISCKISRGETLISGNFTDEETKNIAMILKTGSLPTPIHIIEETIVGPGLSKTSQQQGLKSILIAIILIFLFMLLFYTKSGVIACLALLFNIFFILTGLAQINAVLTLEGIAGFILTLGMAIDANVLINERIKEELKLGKNIREAIRLGYDKASSSIIDSNLTTILTAAILYFYCTGAVRGFALTLIIGIVFSFFTAVYISRLFLYFREQNRRLKSISFGFSFFNNFLKNTKMNFVKFRFLAYIFSLSIMILGGWCFYKSGGFKYGIEFTGGYNTIVEFDEKINVVDLKKHLSEKLNENVDIKEYGADNVLKISAQFVGITDKQTVINKLSEVIKEFLSVKKNEVKKDEEKAEKEDESDNFEFISTERVEASMAEDIKRGAKQAILLVLLVLFLYIFVRFKKWQFGFAAVLTLVHDVLIIFSVYGISRYFGYIIEVNQVFIAAILTVIGYAINNTVIIFDRIRENTSNKNLSFRENVNLAVNNTLSRTIITSFTTIMVVLIIFLFGGVALEHFAYILLCGFMFGTYSSIFISAPILADLFRKK